MLQQSETILGSRLAKVIARRADVCEFFETLIKLIDVVLSAREIRGVLDGFVCSIRDINPMSLNQDK